MAGRDLVFRFIGVDAGAGHEFDKMAEKSSFAHHAIGKMALGALAAGATVAVASVKMASDFQSAMELIHSQAGASQAEVNKMSGAVLALAGPTATAPAELAAGLYHLESAGLRGQKALDALKTAALGAKVGQANLEDVTNALNATIASGIPGSQNMSKAMGALNATVGAGDMRMQDLAEAFGTGFLATVKGFGVTLNDAGAALATFGDNNIRGADAATQLRMAVLFMAKPAAGASVALGKIGLNAQSLSKDLQTGGLNKAITDLHDHLEKAGYTGNKAGAILLDAFGHKAGTGLSVLVGQYGRFESKIEEVRKGSEHFGESVKATTHTFAFQWASAKAASEAFFIRLGTVLLPLATAAMSGISKAFSVTSDVIMGVWGVISGSGAAENHLKGFSSNVQVALIKVGDVLRDVFSHAKTIFGDIVKAVTPFADKIKDLALHDLMQLWQVLSTRLWPILRQVVTIFKADVLPVLTGVAQFILSKLYPAVVSLAGTALKGLHGELKTVEKTIRDNRPQLEALFVAFKKVATFIIDVLKPVLTVVLKVAFWALGENIKILITTIGWGVTAFTALWNAGKSVAGFFTGPFLRAIGTLVSMSIGGFKLLGDVVLGTFASIIHGISTVAQHVPFLPHSLKESLKAADHAISDFKNGFDNNMQGLANAAAGWGASIGNHLEDGIVVGINGRRANTNAIAYSAGAAAANAIRHGAAVSSPSKITMYVGRMLAEGIIVGFTGARERLLHALSSTMQTALEHLHTYVLRVTNTMMSRVSAARGVLAQAYSNRSQYAGQLAGQLASGANLTNAIDSNTGTVGNLSSFLASQVAQMKAFAGALKGLSRRHLASGLLQQIAEAGPTQGLALARSITPGQIGALNAEQAQLNRYASAAANTTAQSVYAAEIARDTKAVQAQLAEQRKANHLLELIARRVSGEKTAKQVAAELANLKRTTGRSLGLA